VLHVSSYPHYDLEPVGQLGVETVCIDRYGYNWSTKLQSVNKLLDMLAKRV
jgi:hypothetical protein